MIVHLIPSLSAQGTHAIHIPSGRSQELPDPAGLREHLLVSDYGYDPLFCHPRLNAAEGNPYLHLHSQFLNISPYASDKIAACSH